MDKQIIKTNLHALPPYIAEVFDLIKSCGSEYMALFGGALRDADYASKYQETRNIKDFDLRVWIDPAQQQNFIARLADITQSKVTETPSPGTYRIRYCLDYKGIELDISLRSIPAVFHGKTIPIEAVAQDRAADSDIGLSSIALDPNLNAWVTPEYIHDRDNKTLTVYPSQNQKRLDEYSTRMQYKFPSHSIILLKNDYPADKQKINL